PGGEVSRVRGSSWLVALVAAVTVALPVLAPSEAAARSAGSDSSVPRAQCGPGSRPETGLQGQVSVADRRSGRNRQGFSCNMELLGSTRARAPAG
ncbi:MAG TPA: hypothetical protein VHU91_05385, partial [Mycobacteriales bacterium]|nr:hypothetical protein [Mycobacteriales bacterium]